MKINDKFELKAMINLIAVENLTTKNGKRLYIYYFQMKNDDNNYSVVKTISDVPPESAVSVVLSSYVNEIKIMVV